MGLSINPASLFEVLLKSRQRNRDLAANYLDAVAEEARILAEIWDRVIEDLSNETHRFEPDKRALEVLREYKSPNFHPFSRLEEFYYSISRTVQGKLDKECHENVMLHLGSLLYNRNLTLETYQRTVDRISRSSLVESENSLEYRSGPLAS